jgi:uncharacterized protein YodC (DUF2158 family)
MSKRRNALTVRWHLDPDPDIFTEGGTKEMNVGSVVRLNGMAAPVMAITAISGGVATCMWFDQTTQAFKTQEIPIAALSLAPPGS